VASNQAGTTHGPDATFTTSGATLTTVFTSFAVPAVPPTATTPFTFPVEGPGTTTGAPSKALTRKQKLATALKTCHKKNNKAKRAVCERQARRKYGPVKKKR
jgi:hypothetical protein